MSFTSKESDKKSSKAGLAKYSNNNRVEISIEHGPRKVEDNDIKITFLEERKKLMLKMVDPDNTNPYLDETFKPVRDALKLEEALKEKNKTNVLDIFCRKSRAQRIELLTLYKSTYKKDFTKDLHHLYKKSILRVFDVVTLDLITAFTNSMKEAIDTNNYLYALLLIRICSKEELKQIAASYKILFKKQLEKEFESFPKGVKELYTYYYNFEFEPTLSPSDVENEVDKLIKNFKTKDTNFLATLFSRRPSDFIQSVCNLFYHKSEKTVLECFKDKMNTQVYDSYSLLYDLVNDVPTAIGKYMAKNVGLSSDLVLDLIILRSEVDLGKVIQVCYQQNGCQLLESCEKAFKDERRTIAQYFLVPFTPS